MKFYFFILCVFLSMILFHLLTKSYLNPYKLIMCFGKKGSGKTTYLTRIAQKSIRKGIKVYSNTEIVGTELFNVKDFGYRNFDPDSIILIDEVSLIWDNRSFKSFDMNIAKFLRLQRHNRLTIYLFSQTFDVDKKIRDMCDELYLLTNFMRVWSMIRRIKKRVTVANNTDSDGNHEASGLVEDYQFDSILFGGLSFIFIPRWIPFFDTRSLATKFEPIETTYQLYERDQYNALKLRGYIQWKGKRDYEKFKNLLLSFKKHLLHRKEVATGDDRPSFFKIDRGT